MKRLGCLVSLSLVAGLFWAVPAAAQWTNGQDGEYVVGQADWTTDDSFTTQNGLSWPRGAAVDLANGKLYIADSHNHRILRFSYPITGNQPDAELVFGQADFTSGDANAGGTATKATLNSPEGLAVDSTGRLWVCDLYNNRVVWYDAAYSDTSNQPDADGVLGQADFVSVSANRGGTAAANTMCLPAGLCVDASGTLFVADEANNRVLRFDSAASKANGASADGVLGQSSFTSNSGATTATGMSSPNGVALHGGSLFVADRANHRVLRFDSAASKANGASADGVLGQSGFISNSSATTATGMNTPVSVACDGRGRLYVGDSHNRRVITFDAAAGKADGAPADNVLGQADFTTVTVGTTQSTMNWLHGVAIDSTNGKLLVADSNSSRVCVFAASSSIDNTAPVIDQTGPLAVTLSEDGSPTAWSAPTVSATDADSDTLTWSVPSITYGTATVSGTGASPATFTYTPPADWTGSDSFVVQVSDGHDGVDTITVNVTVNAVNDAPVILTAPEGYSYDIQWGSEGSGDGEFDEPSGIALDSSGNVYVADSGYPHPRIQKFDEDGTFITTWGSEGPGDGEFCDPTDIAVDPSGNVYVADSGYPHPRIQKFDGDGTFITKWGSLGSGNGEFYYPYGIAVDSSGNVYVADTYNHRIQKFDGDGTFITKWGSQGTGDGEFKRPEGIAVDPSGNVYVLDAGNHRIQKFDGDGTFITAWGSEGTGDGEFGYPYGIAVDPSGNVYVADAGNNRIQRFDGDGNFITAWGSQGTGDGQLNYPYGIAVDPSGNVYVADKDNNRIQRFTYSAGTAAGASVAVTTSEDSSPTAFGLALYARDADNDTLTWSVSSAASHGTATVSGTGASPTAFTYAPEAGYAGLDSFVVQVSDGNGGTDTVTINVTVTSAAAEEPVVKIWPEGSMIAGNTLATAQWTRTGAAECNGTAIPGEFTFTDPTVTPPLGEYRASAVFTPDDRVNFFCVDGSITVKVHASQDAMPLAFVEGPIVSPVGDTTAVVSWKTNRAATAVLDYGPAGGKLQAVVSDLETSHSVELTGLTAATEYSLTVTATDLEANTATSHEVTFVTLAVADTTGPQLISGPFVLHVTDTNIVLALRTDEDAAVSLEVYSGGGLVGTVSASATAQQDAVIALEGLTPETTYTFVITLEDAFGNTTVWDDMAGALLPVTTLATADTSAPVIVEGPIVETVGANHIILRWQTDEPANSTVTYGSGGAMDLVTGEDGFRTEHRACLANLEPLTAYTLQISSADVAGNGPTTSEEIVVTTLSIDEVDTEAPVFVVAPVVLGHSDTTATIYWETNEPADTVVEYGAAEPLTGRVSIAKKSLSHEVTITGLTPGTTYYYRCSSTDMATPGNTTYGSAAKQDGLSSFITDTDADLTAPALAEGPELIVLNSDFASLRFVTDEAASSSVTYWPDGTPGSARTVASLGYTLEHIAALTGLTPETTYYYIATVVDPSGNSSATVQMSFTTPAASAADTALPAFTSEPQKSSVGETRATIAWSTGTFTSGEVWCSTEQSTFSKVFATAGLGESHEVLLSGLEPGTKYYIQVVAVNQKEACSTSQGFWIETESEEGQGGFGLFQLFMLKILAILAAIFGFELHVKGTS